MKFYLVLGRDAPIGNKQSNKKINPSGMVFFKKQVLKELVHSPQSSVFNR